MSEAEKLANTARAKLAAALSALQSSHEVPDALMEVADPIAEAMGALHSIERTHGADLGTKDVALSGVRAALDLLQSLDSDHPALALVMDNVAGSLAQVHKLSRMQPAAAPSQPSQPQPAPQAQPVQPSRAAAPPRPISAVLPAAVQPAVQPPVLAQSQPAAQVQPAAQPQPAARPVQVAPPQLEQPQVAPQAAVASRPAGSAPPSSTTPGVGSKTAPIAAVQAPGSAKPVAAQAPVAEQPAPARQPSSPGSERASKGGTVRMQGPASQKPAPASQKGVPDSQGNVTVELGAHSVSNFYKGLGGNDVVEHGGLFVATYKIAKMGSVVKLRVLLPGDYEFTAMGSVQWIREPMSGGDSSEPGFGVRFSQITPEGRQLVYRYTRNREPMFYDDL